MFRPLLPLPFPDRPVWKRMTSCTLRARQKRRFLPWTKACGLVRVINGLDSGGVSTKLTTSGTGDTVDSFSASCWFGLRPGTPEPWLDWRPFSNGQLDENTIG